MRQVLQNYRTGEVRVDEVPAPALRSGAVLVANRYSLISAGTERMKVETGRMSLLGKARSCRTRLKSAEDAADRGSWIDLPQGDGALGVALAAGLQLHRCAVREQYVL